MKFVICGDYIFNLESLQWCNNCSETDGIYFDFGFRKFFYEGKSGMIFFKFKLFLENGDLSFDVENMIEIEKLKEEDANSKS